MSVKILPNTPEYAEFGDGDPNYEYSNWTCEEKVLLARIKPFDGYIAADTSLIAHHQKEIKELSENLIKYAKQKAHHETVYRSRFGKWPEKK